MWTIFSNTYDVIIQIAMPMVSGRVLQVVLEYLYTGRCLFPPDDLNLGIEVWETGSGTSPLVRTALITYVVTMVRK